MAEVDKNRDCGIMQGREIEKCLGQIPCLNCPFFTYGSFKLQFRDKQGTFATVEVTIPFSELITQAGQTAKSPVS